MHALRCERKTTLHGSGTRALGRKYSGIGRDLGMRMKSREMPLHRVPGMRNAGNSFVGGSGHAQWRGNYLCTGMRGVGIVFVRGCGVWELSLYGDAGCGNCAEVSFLRPAFLVVSKLSPMNKMVGYTFGVNAGWRRPIFMRRRRLFPIMESGKVSSLEGGGMGWGWGSA